MSESKKDNSFDKTAWSKVAKDATAKGDAPFLERLLTERYKHDPEFALNVQTATQSTLEVVAYLRGLPVDERIKEMRRLERGLLSLVAKNEAQERIMRQHTLPVYWRLVGLTPPGLDD